MGIYTVILEQGDFDRVTTLLDAKGIEWEVHNAEDFFFGDAMQAEISVNSLSDAHTVAALALRLDNSTIQ